MQGCRGAGGRGVGVQGCRGVGAQGCRSGAGVQGCWRREVYFF